MFLCCLFVLCQTLVENPLQPTNPLKLKLVKETSFVYGGKREARVFETSTSLAVDSRNNLYLVDPQRAAVVRLDEKGLVTKTLRAPTPDGRFKAPLAIASNAKNHLAVLDAVLKQVFVFDLDSGEATAVPFKMNIRAIDDFYLLENGNYLFTSVQQIDAMNTLLDGSLYNANLEVVKSLVSTPFPQAQWSITQLLSQWTLHLRDHLNIRLKQAPLMALVTGSSFAVALSDQYSFQIYDQNGNARLSASKQSESLLTLKENFDAASLEMLRNLRMLPFLYRAMNMHRLKEARKQAAYPVQAPPLNRLVSLENGCAALTNYNAKKGQGTLDVFDKEGNLRASLKYKGPGERLFGIGGRIFATEHDKKGRLKITSYTLRGWSNN